MPHLEVFQSLWAMQGSARQTQPSLEQQCEQIAAAGFDGIGIDHAAREIPATARAKRLLDDNGLACLITAFPVHVEDLHPTLEAAVALDARMVCVNARYLPLSIEEGVDFVHACLALARSAQVSMCFETHRFTLTNDLLYTLQLLERISELELAADLSHFVVAREYPSPVDEQHQAWTEKLLARSVALQGRISSREQVQVPLHFTQHRAWVDQFFAWWRLGMQLWLQRMPSSATLNFMCELGPPPYALTDVDGLELSDRWQEALQMKERIREMWQEESGVMSQR